MSILKLFGLSGESASTNEHSGSDGESIRRIAKELDALPDDQALRLATFAYVLGRVAHADSHFSEAETEKMQDIVQVLGHIPESQAVLLVEIAKHQVRLFGGTDNVAVSQRFRQRSTPEQLSLIHI